MNRIFKRIITMTLILALFVCGVIPVIAVEDEEYLSDLKIIYADDYSEAEEILEDSELEDYILLDANLNDTTGEIGVWLAYKTTTDIEDAITDIAVMQMDGGYKEGNYQEMIKQSLAEYVAMGENYLTAIEYFSNAYNAGNYLADIAHRQLNFYNVVTVGIEDQPSFEGERIGDIFISGDITAKELAVIFMEGNSYALDNIRSLLAMGVSYNEDDATYLEKVTAEAEKYSTNKDLYIDQDLRDLATVIAPTITVFGDMLEELDAQKYDLNYNDDVITELELKYMEYQLIAEMLKATEYMNGKTLYDFCIKYTLNTEDVSDLYPLAAALNEGQIAMTKVNHYYDVVRYSMTIMDDAEIEAELDKMEEEYGEYPFNVYSGVDRTIFYDTFALTSEAYRADAYTDEGLLAALYSGKLSSLNIAMTAVGSVGACLLGAGLARYGYMKISASKASSALATVKANVFDSYKAYEKFNGTIGFNYYGNDNPARVTERFFECIQASDDVVEPNFANWNFQQQYEYLDKFFTSHPDSFYANDFGAFRTQVSEYMDKNQALVTAKAKAQAATNTLNGGMNLVYGMSIVGGIMLLSSAITLGISIRNYYNPKYSDIPTALVDLIDTPDGDRYIKYDVVYGAELGGENNNELVAADLNAFEAQRWNALYYTKSYEAGKPLLADEFKVSTRSNVPDAKYMPVHGFGEVICYNLNKYNFDYDDSIYLSIRQSSNQKSAVADVPELIGSVFSTGWLVLAGGCGITVGAGATILAENIVKRKKNKASAAAESEA